MQCMKKGLTRPVQGVVAAASFAVVVAVDKVVGENLAAIGAKVLKVARLVGSASAGGIGHMMKDCRSLDENQTKWFHHAAHSTFLASAILCESSYDKCVIMDSGATSQMTYNKDWLTNFKVVNPPEVVVLGDGHRVFAHGIGTLAVKLQFDDEMIHTADCSFLICRACCSRSNLSLPTERSR